MIIAQYIIVIASALFLLAYFFLDKKKWREIVLAAVITALWVGFSGIYAYKSTNLAILGFNLFPFFAWTAGLVLLKAIHDKLGLFKYAKSVLLYVIAVLVFELVGYHLLGIQLSSNYPGLFGLDLMHAPWYSQAYYLCIGPAYLLVLMSLNKKSTQPVKKRKL